MFPSNLFITGYEMEGQSIVTRSIIFGLCFYTPSTADENLILPHCASAMLLLQCYQLRHFLQIAESFYALDNQGTGTINLKELQLAARKAGHPQESAEVARTPRWAHVDGQGSNTD